MNIVSIDASTKSSGIALFENGQLTVYDNFTNSSSDLIKRISHMINKLDEFLNKYHADKIILEEVHPEDKLTNIKTHKALMYLQAAIAFLVHERHSYIQIEYLYPSEWRKLCGIKTGRGTYRSSLKEQDIAFVKERFGLNVNDDIADAICIGYAYLNKPKPEEKKSAW